MVQKYAHNTGDTYHQYDHWWTVTNADQTCQFDDPD